MEKKFPALTSIKAHELLQTWGFNEIVEEKRHSPFMIILRNIRGNYILYLLLLASGASFLLGEFITGSVIFLAIILIITIAFVQEYKAEAALDSLKQMMSPTSSVIRDGKEQQIESKLLVPGDVVVLRTGDRVPADGAVLSLHSLRVDESILTGESAEQSKIEVGDSSATISDEAKIYMGTYIVNGKCVYLVTHTGMNTRFGGISKMITKSEKALPLQEKVNKIASLMVIIAIVVSVLMAVILLLQAPVITSKTLVHILILAIALAVSAFPEGLPVVMMTALAAGTTRMAKKNAIVNRMSIIETLGETTIICTDKTGTLTKGEMTVKKVILDGKSLDVSGIGYSESGSFLHGDKVIDVSKNKQMQELFRCCVLCNTASVERDTALNELKPLGSHTEVALLVLAAKGKVFRDDMQYEIIDEIPFSPESKSMTVKVRIAGKTYLFVKGAPEVIIERSGYVFKDEKKVRMSATERQQLFSQTANMTNQAYRTLALGYCEDPSGKMDSNTLTFLGIVGIEDPPREGIQETLQICQKAGISVKMVTGDHKDTALAIAAQIGLVGKVYTGDEIDAFSDDELTIAVHNAAVFARVRPEHKLRIVEVLQKSGEIVTMTGDGVNDAPALKMSNIGVAMGKTGTDVSRSVADLTLKDDNFITIVEAIREGRTVFNNIRKFVTYQLSCNYAELTILLVSVLLSPILSWQTPILTSLHILFMNMITDDFPAITLALNRSSIDVMKEAPRRNTRIITKNLFVILFASGSIMAILALLTYFVSFNILGYSVEVARTITLLSLVLLEVAGAFNFRSFRYPVLFRSLLVNKYLFYASLASIFATILVIYTPLNVWFETVPIGPVQLAIALYASFVYVLLADIFKAINERTKYIVLT